MIKGKYLRERKALRTKRRIKLLFCTIIVFLIYKIIFSSFSLYKSEANSEADIDIAFYVLNDQYSSQTINLKDMLPGEHQNIRFTVSNFMDDVDEDGNDVQNITETDMRYELKIRTTTNLPLEYKLYIDQNKDAIPLENLNDVLEEFENQDDAFQIDKYGTFFNKLVNSAESDELKAKGITDSYDFVYTEATKKLYDLDIYFPEDCKNDYRYQDIIECVEISIDSKQVIAADSEQNNDENETNNDSVSP